MINQPPPFLHRLIRSKSEHIRLFPKVAYVQVSARMQSFPST